MMNYEFTVSLLVFTCIMLLFNIIKDFIIFKNITPSVEFKKQANKRWIISYIIGIILIFFIWGEPFW